VINVEWSKTANEKLKDGFEGVMGASLIAAIVGHMLVFQFFPEMTTEDWRRAAVAAVTLEPLGDVALPVAPEPIARPAVPVISDDVSVATTLPRMDWFEPAKPPPPPPSLDRGAEGRQVTAFVVFTVAPVLLDPEGFQRALRRAYPQSLRDAGVGGTVELHVQIDTEGRVVGATIGTSSGYERLDRVALDLTDGMRFRPALNRDKRVAVLVSIPIEFRVNR